MQKYIPLRRRFFFLLALFATFGFTALSGNGSTSISLTASVPNIRFTTWPIGTAPYQNETLTNRGTSSVKISQITASGQFGESNLTVPMTLSPGKSVTFAVRFLPTTSGNHTGQLTVISNAPTVTVTLSGTGAAVGTLSISPASYSFGNVRVGETVVKAATLKADSLPISISSATTTNPEFSLSGLKLPLTLGAGKAISISVNFKPASSGAASAQIAFLSILGKSSGTATVSGTGVAVQAHEVDLMWSPSSSAVVGYNVYRGTSAGGPYSKLNSQSVVNTAYTDSSVNAGKTYFYVSSSVASTGVESGKSNEVKAIIPSP